VPFDVDYIVPDELFGHDPSFDAARWLEEEGSPRLGDMPELGGWINESAGKHNINGRLLLVMAEKEQSAITRGPLDMTNSRDRRAYYWLMGCGCYEDGRDNGRYRGPDKQVAGAARTLRSRADGRGAGEGDAWIAEPGKPFSHPGRSEYLCTPRNWPTAALYTYNPSIHGNRNLYLIWTRWFGDPTPENQQEVETADLKVVLDAEVIECNPVEEDGVTRCDLRPMVEALGHRLHYRAYADGRRRIYIKKAP